MNVCSVKYLIWYHTITLSGAVSNKASLTSGATFVLIRIKNTFVPFKRHILSAPLKHNTFQKPIKPQWKLISSNHRREDNHFRSMFTARSFINMISRHNKINRRNIILTLIIMTLWSQRYRCDIVIYRLSLITIDVQIFTCVYSNKSVNYSE